MAQLHQHQQQQQSSHQQHQLQQLQQNGLSGLPPQVSNHSLHQPDKIGGASSMTMDGSISNSFRGNDQVYLVCLHYCHFNLFMFMKR